MRFIELHSRQLITTFPFWVRTLQFFPATKKALHFLQKRLRHLSGIRTLYLEAILRANVTYLLAYDCRKDACSNKVSIRFLAVCCRADFSAAAFFTILLQRIKLYKRLVQAREYAMAKKALSPEENP